LGAALAHLKPWSWDSSFPQSARHLLSGLWLICATLLSVGIYIFALSKREFDRPGQKLTPRAHGTSKLMMSGIYSSVQHPHNLASVLLNLGIDFAFKSTLGLTLALASIILGYWFTLEEEKLLIRQFGDRYREYKAKVPMFVPKLRRRVNAVPVHIIQFLSEHAT
jgi:protein-S-isoprenylcysteine O-methyltransferase Ste14